MRGRVSIREINARLDDGRGIKIVEKTYSMMMANAEFICQKGHQWTAPPHRVVYLKKGCPTCYEARRRDCGGWSANRYIRLGIDRIALYKIEFKYNRKSIFKVGITSKPRVRWRHIRAKNIQMISPLEWGTPDHIVKREREIMKASRQYRACLPNGFNGRSECFTQLIDPSF